MPDAIRTLTQLLSDITVNTSGTNTSQKMRNVILSLAGCYAEMRVVAGVTAQTGITTAVPFTGWTTDGESRDVVPDFAAGTLTIPADGAGDYDIEVQGLHISAPTASRTFTFELYVNGVASGHLGTFVVGAGGEAFDVNIGGIITLADADEIELYVAASGSADITPTTGRIRARRLA